MYMKIEKVLNGYLVHILKNNLSECSRIHKYKNF